MCQIFWVTEFLKLYPHFCCTIADKYAVFHSRGQCATQVCLLYRVNVIQGDYDAEDLLSELEVLDEDFHTNLTEPSSQEE